MSMIINSVLFVLLAASAVELKPNNGAAPQRLAPSQRFGPSSGDNGDENNPMLRLHRIEETTDWPFVDQCDVIHYVIRIRHSANELMLNLTLLDYARIRALTYAWFDGEVPQEVDNDLRWGENFHYAKDATTGVNCSDVMEDWYMNEEKGYNYDEPKLTPENKEFTQLVWKPTTDYGCGQALSHGPKGGVYTVCYYDKPPVAGEEKENVGSPIFPIDELSLSNNKAGPSTPIGAADNGDEIVLRRL